MDATSPRASTAPPEPTFGQGFAKVAPILPGMLPFGMIAGVSAAEAGLDWTVGLMQSVLVFAGAAQIAMTQLMGENAVPLIIIATGLVINLRFLMYSASLAPHVNDIPGPWRWLMAYLLTDQAYALSVTRFPAARPRYSIRSRIRFYMGVGVPLWIVWQAVAAAGYFLGGGVPEGWQLGFAIPLGFMAIMVPAVQDRASVAAAVVAAATSVAASALPYNLGLFLAALLGITTGILVEARSRRQQEDTP